MQSQWHNSSQGGNTGRQMNSSDVGDDGRSPGGNNTSDREILEHYVILLEKELNEARASNQTLSSQLTGAGLAPASSISGTPAGLPGAQSVPKSAAPLPQWNNVAGSAVAGAPPTQTTGYDAPHYPPSTAFYGGTVPPTTFSDPSRAMHHGHHGSVYNTVFPPMSHHGSMCGAPVTTAYSPCDPSAPCTSGGICLGSAHVDTCHGVVDAHCDVPCAPLPGPPLAPMHPHHPHPPHHPPGPHVDAVVVPKQGFIQRFKERRAVRKEEKAIRTLTRSCSRGRARSFTVTAAGGNVTTHVDPPCGIDGPFHGGPPPPHMVLPPPPMVEGYQVAAPPPRGRSRSRSRSKSRSRARSASHVDVLVPSYGHGSMCPPPGMPAGCWGGEYDMCGGGFYGAPGAVDHI